MSSRRPAPCAIRLAAAVCVCGLSLVECSAPAPGQPGGEVNRENLGDVGLSLQLGTGASLSSFQYTIDGPNGYHRTATVDVRTYVTLATIVTGIPAGTNYHIAIQATLDDGSTPCSGNATFSVSAGITTPVPIFVTCSAPPTKGSLFVNGSVNVCPNFDSFLIIPARVDIGATMNLSASAYDLDNGPSPLKYTWTATDGTLSDPTAPQSVFTCAHAGTPTITLTVTDGDNAAGCPAVSSAPVVCLCKTDADCGENNACATSTCTDGLCSVTYAPAGTPLPTPTGDCNQYACDGRGHIDAAPLPVEVPCDVSKVCDGTGGTAGCQPIKISALRVGDGQARGLNTASPVFLDQYTIAGALISTTNLPTSSAADPGGNQPFTHAFTDSRNETSDGMISRSVDGRYIVMAGYAAPPGTLSLVQQTDVTVKRVVARVDAAGNVDTSTVLETAFDGLDARSAASLDGSAFWVGGGPGPLSLQNGGDAASGGIWYVPFKASGGVQLGGPITRNDNDLTLNPAARVVRIFGGQLYCDVADSALSVSGIYTVGNGLPTASAQQVTRLPGTFLANNSPFGFVLLDRNSTVPGLDTLYIADDDGASSNVGGIQKWTFDGTVWKRVAIFQQVGGSSSPEKFRGLTGLVTYNNTVTLVTTTAALDGAQDSLVVFVDDGSASIVGARIVPASGLYRTFRGVALSPHN